MQGVFFARPFPRARTADAQVAPRIEIESRQLTIPQNIAAMIDVSVPQVKQRARHRGHTRANISKDSCGPILEMRAMLAIAADDSIDAAPAPIARERVRHHVIAAAGDAGVVESVPE